MAQENLVLRVHLKLPGTFWCACYLLIHVRGYDLAYDNPPPLPKPTKVIRMVSDLYSLFTFLLPSNHFCRLNLLIILTLIYDSEMRMIMILVTLC